MSPARAKALSILKSCGAILKRRAKHEVWQLPNGQSFTCAKTPSDIRGDRNNLSHLKHALGTVAHGSPGERRIRKPAHGRDDELRVTPSGVHMKGTLADQLRGSGVVEEALREQVTRLESALKLADEQIRQKSSAILMLEQEREACWICRFKRWRISR